MSDAGWSRVQLHRGIQACEVCLSRVAPGSANVPRHQLRADGEFLLIEGQADTKILAVMGRPASKCVWCIADAPQVWQLEVPFPFHFQTKRPSMSQPHAVDERSLARAPRSSMSSPGTGRVVALAFNTDRAPPIRECPWAALSRGRCCLLGRNKNRYYLI